MRDSIFLVAVRFSRKRAGCRKLPGLVRQAGRMTRRGGALCGAAFSYMLLHSQNVLWIRNLGGAQQRESVDSARPHTGYMSPMRGIRDVQVS